MFGGEGERCWRWRWPLAVGLEFGSGWNLVRVGNTMVSLFLAMFPFPP